MKNKNSINRLTLAFASVLLVAVILCGCNSSSTEGRAVIIGKYYRENQKCICTFYYTGLGIRGQDFSDSCAKYNIGDTIAGRRK